MSPPEMIPKDLTASNLDGLQAKQVTTPAATTETAASKVHVPGGGNETKEVAAPVVTNETATPSVEPMANNWQMVRKKLQEINVDAISYVKGKVLKTGRRTELNELYVTLEDFERADPDVKRVVLIGCTGAGKSTIGNIAAGWRFVGRSSSDGEYQFDWVHSTGAAPLFEARADGKSVTSKTAFANIHWLGDEVDFPPHTPIIFSLGSPFSLARPITYT